jgi:hypothetical protein
MANIQALYQTGKTLYAVCINPLNGQFYNAGVWEAYNSAHWGVYAVALTEYAGSGIYSGSYPIATPLLLSTDIIFAQAGVSPTLGDPVASNIYQSQGVNLAGVNWSVAAAVNLALSAGGMIASSVAAGTLTPSAFTTNLSSSVNAAYQGRICLFTSGVLIGQVGNIIAYDGSTFTLTVGGPFTAAPSVADQFIII